MRYQVRWEIGFPANVVSSDHNSEKGAKNKAREMSMKCEHAQVAAINPAGVRVKQWYFEKGKQTKVEVFGYEDTETKAEPDSKSHHSVNLTDEEKEEIKQIKNDPGDVPEVLKRKPAPQVAPLPGMTPLGMKPSKESGRKSEDTVPPGEKEAEPKEAEMASRAEKLIEEFQARPGTNREKLVKFMVNNLNQNHSERKLTSVVYGKGDDDLVPSMKMVLKGMQTMIDGRRLPLKIVKEKNEKKETVIGLHTK